ncbi:unnamed protein product [Cylicostephanus goldi]|uniref:Uncharacterized protein n=1 Tax=Cylicostephanus goldi TaxID=71465 RepID=A0A3P7M3A3_CYLGO|nr:unnamed protein product [Cylicostephanus goldi]
MMFPVCYIEEVRESTKELAELIQKHASHGKKSTFPEDKKERQKMCVCNLDVLAICDKEIKRGTRSLH